MSLRLYDTKTASVRPLETVHPGHVGIYLCGPTVQGSPHVGHLRAAINFDVLVRWLKRLGFQVTYVRNVTDIDDKILAKAAAADVQWWALAAHFERIFQAAYRALGTLPPTVEPRATGHISEQIELTQVLLERKKAYLDGQGNVYFSVCSQEDYGSLTRQHLESMRILDNEETAASGKKDPRDFVLWKAKKPGEPETAAWPSPWGRGRPGWHLECSAMARRYLGDEFDIHGGGLDLRFPHHENEQAQSHGAGWPFARLWMHNAWVTMAGEKMSKSLGNTTEFFHLLEQTAAPVIRFALASVHYRSTIEWSDRTLVLAQNSWEKFRNFVNEASVIVGELGEIELEAQQLPTDFVSAMNDDLNVAAALAVVYEQVKLGRQLLAAKTVDVVVLARVLQATRSMLDVLGLDPGSKQWKTALTAGRQEQTPESAALTALVENLLEQRSKARERKDWVEADTVRNLLVESGINVEDSPTGVHWHLGGRSEG